MSTRAIIWTIVVIIIIVALGWLSFSYGGNHQPATTSSTATTTVATSTASTNSGGTEATTLHSVMTQGGNYTCTIETIQGGRDTTGTVYGASGNTRLDLMVENGGVETTMHIIRTGTTSYTWVDGQTTGTEASITSTSPIATTPASGGQIEVTGTTNVSSTCHPWIPDATQFVPPAGITFNTQ